MNADQLKECREAFKPCPLCGVEDGDHDEGTPFLWIWEGDEGWYVACGNCGCRSGERETEQKAMEAWNTRLSNPQPMVSREAIYDLVEQTGGPIYGSIAKLTDAIHALQLSAPMSSVPTAEEIWKVAIRGHNSGSLKMIADDIHAFLTTRANPQGTPS